MHESDTEQARHGHPRAHASENGSTQHGPARRAEFPECPRGDEDQDPRASDPGQRPQHEPRGEALRQRHAQCHEANDEEPGPDGGGSPDTQGHHRQGAEQVTEVVGRSQPSAFADRYRSFLLHHGKDWREGEPSDAHGDSEGRESRQRDDQRRGCRRGLRLAPIRIVAHAVSLGGSIHF